jgi:hypothetical protein
MQITIDVPANLAQEVVDFVDFLKAKYVTATPIESMSRIISDHEDDRANDLMMAQSLSVSDWDNNDDEVWNHVSTH